MSDNYYLVGLQQTVAVAARGQSV